MSSNGVKPFENNWAYLKMELRWLDRVLMLAVSRHRRDEKTISKVANSPEDKATSHWWKGIIAVNRGIDDREGPPPKVATTPQTTTISYTQHLENLIRASHQAGVVLALPQLRDRLSLTNVEKNILLMAIAPEINRRYGRLYDYLQEDAGALADLPTVDLCLRLLCRNDYDWQQARARLTASDSLVNRGLVEWIGDEDGTLLSQQVRVTDEVANYLLADAPDPQALQAILRQAEGEATPSFAAEPPPPPPPAAETIDPGTEVSVAAPVEAASTTTLLTHQVATSWDHLVLPQTLIQQLQYLSRQAEQRQAQADLPGLMVLLSGASGTGKTLAAATIAAHLEVPLTCIDLDSLSPESYPNILTDAPTDTPSLLLVKQGENWLGRKPQVDQTWLHQWWQWRQQLYGLTLVTVQTLEAVRPSWRQKFNGILAFPHPDAKARRRLWEQALPPEFSTHKINWANIAQQLPLTGGEIQAIAQTMQLDLKAQGKNTVTLTALRQALKLHYPQLTLKAAKS